MQKAIDNMQMALDKQRKMQFEADLSALRAWVNDSMVVVRNGEMVNPGDVYFVPPDLSADEITGEVIIDRPMFVARGGVEYYGDYFKPSKQKKKS